LSGALEGPSGCWGRHGFHGVLWTRGIIYYITVCVGLFWHVSWLIEEIMVTLAEA
jgi:hypothetical protein